LAASLSTAIGDALLSLVEFVWPEAIPQVEELARRVTDIARPDPPFTLQTPDGQVLTGLVVLDCGRALLFIGTRQPAAARTAYRPPERGYEDEPPLWPLRPQYPR
jgi:hypothetical protein